MKVKVEARLMGIQDRVERVLGSGKVSSAARALMFEGSCGP